MAPSENCEPPDGLDCSLIEAIVRAEHHDPFSYLGMHTSATGLVVRAFLPQAAGATLIDARSGEPVKPFTRQHPAGLFVAQVPRSAPFPYRLRIEKAGTTQHVDDPYRFSPQLSEFDRHLIAEGRHFGLYRKLGAHPTVIDGVAGVAFAVWAPNARRVSVVGPFNDWDGRRHVMRCHYDCGVWEIFISGIGPGELYKFEIKDQGTTVPHLKADPFARRSECPPATASIVAECDPSCDSSQRAFERSHRNARDAPISIFEVHLGSWRRRRGQGRRPLTYRELADELVPYAKHMGFTHLELMPITEHPFAGSWGYQPLGLFAPTTRYGSPDDLRYFIQCCHDAGLGVLLDWVPAHFPDDPHGLANFDGTHLYEHADTRLGRHRDWDSLIYNFGRREVANFLIASALYWLDAYGIDGLRVDAVASMLYLDYSRDPGEWLPNRCGGRENLDAIDFLRQLNHEVLTRHPGAITIAEESTAWPMVTRPAEIGGLGFSYKWNLGWMNDTLRYMTRDPTHRAFHHDDITFGLLYAFHENFILPLSHDEVVHGKGALLGKMPGDPWRKFANLRAYYGFMFAYPGKKLLFMGDEFAQPSEWSHERELDWYLLDDPAHAGVQYLVRDLNHLYRSNPALHEQDCEAEGFAWIDCHHHHEASVVAFLRRARDPRRFVVVVCNFTPAVRQDYRVGVPAFTSYRELVNTDSRHYGGSNIGNLGRVTAEAVPMHGYAQSLALTLPPLAVVILEPEEANSP